VTQLQDSQPTYTETSYSGADTTLVLNSKVSAIVASDSDHSYLFTAEADGTFVVMLDGPDTTTLDLDLDVYNLSTEEMIGSYSVTSDETVLMDMSAGEQYQIYVYVFGYSGYDTYTSGGSYELTLGEPTRSLLSLGEGEYLTLAEYSYSETCEDQDGVIEDNSYDGPGTYYIVNFVTGQRRRVHSEYGYMTDMSSITEAGYMLVYDYDESEFYSDTEYDAWTDVGSYEFLFNEDMTGMNYTGSGTYSHTYVYDDVVESSSSCTYSESGYRWFVL